MKWAYPQQLQNIAEAIHPDYEPTKQQLLKLFGDYHTYHKLSFPEFVKRWEKMKPEVLKALEGSGHMAGRIGDLVPEHIVIMQDYIVNVGIPSHIAIRGTAEVIARAVKALDAEFLKAEEEEKEAPVEEKTPKKSSKK